MSTKASITGIVRKNGAVTRMRFESNETFSAQEAFQMWTDANGYERLGYEVLPTTEATR